MRFYSRYSFRFCIFALLVILMFFSVFVFLIPPVLKNTLLLSPKNYMLDSAEVIVSALQARGISESISGFNSDPDIRFTLISPSLKVVEDTAESDNITGKFLVLPGTKKALEGEKVFHSYEEDDAFIYSVLCPAEIDGETYLVYIRHNDRQAATTFHTERRALVFSGLLLLIAPTALLIYTVVDFTSRMNTLTLAITELTSSEYVSGKELSGYDEISNISKILEDYALMQQKTEELRKRFVSDASHELKTPLAAVKLLSDTILLTPEMKHEDICEFLTDISNEIDRLTRICTNLLQITKYDTLSGKAELVPLDLSVVAENVTRILSQPAGNAGLDLRCEFQHGCFVAANYDLVFQIFYNLIENAIKYGAEGKEVRIFLYKKDGNVIFIVDDDGLGIPPGDLERVFERFYRVDKARARATGGTGLGLSIVASAVQTCRGTVEAKNREPHGARFTVKFPSCPPPDSDADQGDPQ